MFETKKIDTFSFENVTKPGTKRSDNATVEAARGTYKYIGFDTSSVSVRKMRPASQLNVFKASSERSQNILNNEF